MGPPIPTRLTILAGAAAALALPAQHPTVQAPQRITESITLAKGATLSRPIIIAANGITIDGRGAVLVGPAQPGQPKTGRGIGVLAEGRSNITLKNFKVHGFESGLVIRGGHSWTLENCDFSANYNDPEHGWGDGERVGGMILTGVSRVAIKNCRAQRNWNGLDLWECTEVMVDGCNFSHCANVCLKLWTSCRNQFRDCDLSYGLRIRKGEVHARDSTCVLIESGSNDNLFARNNITHGGDGVFIRVLNGWISTGNVFRGNDCSYANNNGFEAWSPGNTYLDNKSNHCSYGFWLGGSDRTILIGNEASHNGRPTGFHNAPEPDFGHGGIVIVNGTGSHTLIDSNTCIGNHGGGIVFRGDLGSKGAKWRMRHLIVQRNHLESNQVGIFGRFTEHLVRSSNRFVGNDRETEFEDVTQIRRLDGATKADQRPVFDLVGPSRVKIGEPVRFFTRPDRDGGLDPAGRAPLTYRWRLGAATGTTPTFEHTFAQSGLYSLSLTVDDGKLAALAHRDIYVIDPLEHPATERTDSLKHWRGSQDGGGRVRIGTDRIALVGRSSLQMRPDAYAGAAVQLSYELPAEHRADVSKAQHLSFWLKFQNPNNGGFRGPNPIVRLHAGESAFSFSPARQGRPRNLLGDLPHPEARGGWLRIRIPLAGGPDWHRRIVHTGTVQPHVSGRLEFTTIATNLTTRGAASLAADRHHLYCASGASVFRSKDGRDWRALPSAKAALGQAPQWINGMLTYAASIGERGSLLLTAPARADGLVAHGGRQLIVFDIAEQQWRWHQTVTAMSHGATLVGRHLFGLAHAVGSNYGGPLCRIDLLATHRFDDHSVLSGVTGDNAWWFSRAAQLAALDGRIYAIKNDWLTPQPPADVAGDRLLVLTPQSYTASIFTGGKRWSAKNWQARSTPTTDLGALPFEIGHGAAMVALPPGWNSLIGARGGLFLVAGCSPSNHEGHGRTSDHWAIYDVATKRFTPGQLPATTGAGTSVCRFGDRLIIKRGGISDDATGDGQLWTVRVINAKEAEVAKLRQSRAAPDLRRIDRLSIQFTASGTKPFTVWIDGLQLPGWPE